MAYKKIESVPKDYQELIIRLLNSGIITKNENDEFYITDDMLRMIDILARLGLC